MRAILTCPHDFRVFSDSRNVQKRAAKSDTSGNCLEYVSWINVK